MSSCTVPRRRSRDSIESSPPGRRAVADRRSRLCRGQPIALAVIIGLALALSISGPLRAIGGRVERIAAGDFTEHVRVENRDELGALAANIDRMNDQLGLLYAQAPGGEPAQVRIPLEHEP